MDADNNNYDTQNATSFQDDDDGVSITTASTGTAMSLSSSNINRRRQNGNKLSLWSNNNESSSSSISTPSTISSSSSSSVVSIGVRAHLESNYVGLPLTLLDERALTIMPIRRSMLVRNIWNIANALSMTMTDFVAACYLPHALAFYIRQCLSYAHPFSWWTTNLVQDVEIKDTTNELLVRNALIGIIPMSTFDAVKRQRLLTRLKDGGGFSLKTFDLYRSFGEFFLDVMCRTEFCSDNTSSLCDTMLVQSGAKMWLENSLLVISASQTTEFTNTVLVGRRPHPYVFLCHFTSVYLNGHARQAMESKFAAYKPIFGSLLYMCTLWMTHRRVFCNSTKSLYTACCMWKMFCKRLNESLIGSRRSRRGDDNNNAVVVVGSDNTFRSSQFEFGIDENMAMMMCVTWRASLFMPCLLGEYECHPSLQPFLANMSLSAVRSLSQCASITTEGLDAANTALTLWMYAMVKFVYADMALTLIQYEFIDEVTRDHLNNIIPGVIASQDNSNPADVLNNVSAHHLVRVSSHLLVNMHRILERYGVEK